MFVEFPHLYYENEQRERTKTFWLLAKNIIPLGVLRQKLTSVSFIPEPVQSANPNDPKRFDHVLTLILPWRDPSSGTYLFCRHAI